MKARSLFPVLAAGLALIAAKAWADPPTLPGDGFAASHYEALWTKSPFSVATPEGAPESPDYALVGIARFDGIYYANLIDQKSHEHFLVTTAKPARGLTLISVTPGHGNSDSFAMLERDGQPLTLKMQAASAAAATANPAVAPPPPAPGTAMPAPGTFQPPPVRVRRPTTVVPPRPP